MHREDVLDIERLQLGHHLREIVRRRRRQVEAADEGIDLVDAGDLFGPANRVDDAAMAAGGAIYRDVCSACHTPDGRGVPYLFPALAASPSVRSRDPTTLIRIVLRGARSIATAREPTGPGMPAFGWQLDDSEVAAVLTYIRNSWGAAAAPVTADEVHKARTTLAARSE